MVTAGRARHHRPMTTSEPPDGATATGTTPPGAPPPPPPFPPQPPRAHFSRLRRSTSDRILGGVAGGIAQTYGIDPVLVRVAFAVLSVFGGAGLIAYGVLWVLLPPDDGTLPMVRRQHNERGRIIGVLLLVVGGVILVDRLSPARGHDVGPVAWALVLIAVGIAILVSRANDEVPGP